MSWRRWRCWRWSAHSPAFVDYPKELPESIPETLGLNCLPCSESFNDISDERSCHRIRSATGFRRASHLVPRWKGQARRRPPQAGFEKLPPQSCSLHSADGASECPSHYNRKHLSASSSVLVVLCNCGEPLLCLGLAPPFACPGYGKLQSSLGPRLCS